ncbi:MAG: hypothetical protein J6U44_03120 [Paludibacteraceae bacterium]|nr:hypothetical protein [Paludibacteraceae bacterium]MBO7316140.1 hypothetical protein [Paludibacteraceae bacterium]
MIKNTTTFTSSKTKQKKLRLTPKQSVIDNIMAFASTYSVSDSCTFGKVGYLLN